MTRQPQHVTPSGLVFVAFPREQRTDDLLVYEFAAIDPATLVGWLLGIGLRVEGATMVTSERLFMRGSQGRRVEYEPWGYRYDDRDTGFMDDADLRDPLATLRANADKLNLEDVIVLEALLAWARRRAPFRGGRR